MTGHDRRGSASTTSAGLDLDPTMRVERAVAGPHRPPDWEDARFLERFWFDADAQRAPIGLLSGGERRRLQLRAHAARPSRTCCCSTSPPTTSTSTRCGCSRTSLEDWPGAVVVVSHDRAFLERTVTDVLVIDEQHPRPRVPGGYAAWEAERRAARVRGRATAASTGGAGRSRRGPPTAAARRRRDGDQPRLPAVRRPRRWAGDSATPSGSWAPSSGDTSGWARSWRARATTARRWPGSGPSWRRWTPSWAAVEQQWLELAEQLEGS